MKVAIQQKIEVGGGKFRSAILSLRRALGETQEGMARRIGCSFAAYRKWESGIASPGGQWLIRLLALCPNDEIRRAFDLESGILNLKSGTQFRQDLTPSQEDRLRQLSDAMQGLNAIYEAAEAGHSAADELLRDLADKLTTRGGDWRTLKYARKHREK